MPSSQGNIAAAASHPGRRRGRGRQRRGVETEGAIIEATLRLLATRGIRGTSLDLVAEEVGVAKSSILWHFGSKEDLLVRVAERVFEEVARGPAKDILALPTVEERGEATWRFFAQALRSRPELKRLMLWLILESVEGRPELRARLRQLYEGIRELYEAGLRSVIPDAAKRRRYAIISVASMDGIFLQWLLDPEAIDLEALHEDLRQMHGPELHPDPDKRGARS
jgi:AcrR family transcriptional regulator